MAVSITLANGDTVIVYQTPEGVAFDELDSSLVPLQTGTVVSTSTTSWVNAQALANGGFTVQWNAKGVLMAQDFNAAGAPTDQPYVYTAPVQLAPLAFSSNADGTTTVLPLPTGGSVAGEINPSGTYVQQYNGLGAPNAPQTGFGYSLTPEPPKFAPLADGSYVAEYVTNFHAGSVYVFKFSAAGAITSQTTVHAGQNEGELAGGYSVAGLADGGYVLAWNQSLYNAAQGDFDSDVLVQEYTASGAAVGSNLIIGTYADADAAPLIEALPDGQYVIQWTGPSGLQEQVLTEADPALGTLNADAPIPPPRNGFSGDDQSDFVIENTDGAVVMGEVGPSGQAAYAQVGALGPEWTFVGSGDFPAVSFLLENTNGAVVLGDVEDGQAEYAQVASLGPEWSFVGTGDYLGEGSDQFLIENTNGAVVVGNVVNGQTTYTQVGAVGPEWSFVGSGDFLGDGKDQFLLENTNGAVDIGEVGTNGQAVYTQVAGLGPEWKFVGSGDFLGDGLTDFLIENTNGAVVVGEIQNGQAVFTQVGSVGPEWKFVGVGDYGGIGRESFLLENTNGAVDAGTVVNGQAQYAQIGGLGSEWSFARV